MLQNSDQILELLQTNGHGAKAQVGFDLTLKAVKKVVGGKVTIDKTEVNTYLDVIPYMNPSGQMMFGLNAGVYSLTFDQGIKLDTKHTAFIYSRSSVLRCGAMITSGVYDPSFYVDNMGAIMFVYEPITIEKGARVAQVLVYENYEAEPYQGQWNGARDVK